MVKRAIVVKMLLRVVVVVSEVAPQYGVAAADSDDHGDNDDGGRGDGGGRGDDDCGLSGDDGGDGDGDGESGVLQIACARGGVCKGCVLSSEEGAGTTAKDKKLSLSSNRFSRYRRSRTNRV